MSFPKISLFLIFLIASQTGCKSFERIETHSNSAPLSSASSSTSPSADDKEQKIDEIWRLMRAEHLKDIQPQCEPMRYHPPRGVPSRGVALLLHGYSACPDQYDVLGPRLASLGFEVLVPLLTGHGAKPLSLSPRKDDVEQVPRVGAGWGPMVTRINELGRLFGGEHVLVGLSHGSNLALRAIQLAPSLWDKAFLMAPKLTNEAAFLKFLLFSPIHVLSIDQVSDSERSKTIPNDYGEQKILSMRSGWNKCSELDVNPPGNRGGFCNFENRNAMAMFDFGGFVVDDAPKMAARGQVVKTQVQFVLSHSDDGVCNNTTLKVMTGLRSAGSEVSACTMPAEVPHSMISKHDSPYHKPWLSPLFDSLGLFLTSARNVVGSSPSSSSGAPCELSWNAL